ncbi:hypothetical protein [Aeromonas veronii]|uniref:hypothetical protein n=1 Tax=Aeromonas veronii TaxID=654 RepID=UPI003B9FED18
MQEKKLINVCGYAGTDLDKYVHALNDVDSEFVFAADTVTQKAIMVFAGFPQGKETLEELIEQATNPVEAPALHLFVEEPQKECMKGIRLFGLPRAAFYKTKPLFDDWIDMGQTFGQVLWVNPVNEGIGTEEMVHMVRVAVTKKEEDDLAYIQQREEAARMVDEAPAE